ncbi:beta-galactosidase [Metapseudomonas otitidis]|uniref:beta-galactosidase n=1 Tax=Metapseudomonas otitidis TaxID=319939 RepID=UPI0013F65351|nr:beta-galactosidase [Pseudomonas otitidis]
MPIRNPFKRLILTSSIAVISLTCAATYAAPSHSMKAPRQVKWAEFLGLNVQLQWFPEQSYRHQIAKLKELELQWIRIGLHWELMEPQAGQWNWKHFDQLMQVVEKERLKPLIYMVGSAPHATSAPTGVKNPDQYPPTNPQLFANSFATLASRYPYVKAWQVWNEQNIPSFWQPTENPRQYQQLLESTLSTLDTVRPDATKVIGGHAYYSQMPVLGGYMFEALHHLGSLKPDRVNAYHPYSKDAEGDYPGGGDFISNASTLNQYLRLHSGGPIWATEFGWSSYPGPVESQPVIGEQGQADQMLRRLALMSAMDYDRIFLFTLSDLDARATVRDRYYGLLRLDGSEKPAYKALKRFLQVAGPSMKPLDPPAFANAPAGMISIAWQRADGRLLWMFWAQENGTVQLRRNGSGTLHNPLRGTSKRVGSNGAGMTISVTRELQMLVL